MEAIEGLLLGGIGRMDSLELGRVIVLVSTILVIFTVGPVLLAS